MALTRSPGFLYHNSLIPTKAPDVDSAAVTTADLERGTVYLHFLGTSDPGTKNQGWAKHTLTRGAISLLRGRVWRGSYTKAAEAARVWTGVSRMYLRTLKTASLAGP